MMPDPNGSSQWVDVPQPAGHIMNPIPVLKGLDLIIPVECIYSRIVHRGPEAMDLWRDPSCGKKIKNQGYGAKWGA